MQAPPKETYAALGALDLAESRRARLLLRLRGFDCGRRGFGLKDLLRAGFVLLASDPPREVVFGVVGRFWKRRGDLLVVEPHEFKGFQEPGYAKAAWNFTVRETLLAGAAANVPSQDVQGRQRASSSVDAAPTSAPPTWLTTETRVWCTDAPSLRRFRAYWLVVGPLSGWLRREALQTVKRHAEAAIR